MKKPVSRVWKWRRAVANSAFSASTKHVLSKLSYFMDEDGDSCFPSIKDLCEATSLSKNTVRHHLELAAAAGWVSVLPIGSAGLHGQKWRRKSYYARWPDEQSHAYPLETTEAETMVEGGSIDSAKVGQPLTQDNTTPRISPSARAGVREIAEPDRRKIDGQFRKWAALWPRRSRKKDGIAALRLWRGLTDAQREAALVLTPRYLRTVRDKTKLCGPETALRRRIWESDGVQVKAAFKGPLWMACYFWRLLQPAVSAVTFTGLEEKMIADGSRTREQLVREKRRKFGWPAANRMVSLWHEKRSFFCPAHVEPLGDLFVWVATESLLFAAWARLAEARDWPLPSPIGKGLFFPRVASLDGDLDEAVAAALAAFEVQAAGVFHERT
ncbi:helix-turn-helix domain-containing protein [Allorhizobium borbori]|uniref:Helix-turn-helix domain-containing protein n=1 Tax=Allorhizobium borbori TaxID=485907 RepID=A0A7W6P1P8_9HYPH|nr:helix-turn-helix domain-containing protein [Allorhizobium borbori]MBB4103029.1 hypothetical protein [Allorhizobium borbori]